MNMNFKTTRKQRIAAAEDALKWNERRYYINRKGEKVPFTEGYDACTLVRQDDVPAPNMAIARMRQYIIAAMYACDALVLADKTERTAILSFACPTEPGGAFLSGADGQEDSMCRMTTLHAALSSDAAKPYYETNRAASGPLLPHSFLYAPHVDVYRGGDLDVLDEPMHTQVVSMAAPDLNGLAGDASVAEVRQWYTDAVRMICSYLAGRADAIILGAWGCGGAGMDPAAAAACFRKVLVGEGYGNMFSKVIFAMRDYYGGAYDAFYDALDIGSTDLYVVMDAIPPKRQRKAKSSLKAMKSDFAKGDTVYVVEQTAAGWNVKQAVVKSSGAKYVTVITDGKPVRFLTSQKPILVSEKPHAYLVGSAERAQLMKDNLAAGRSK